MNERIDVTRSGPAVRVALDRRAQRNALTPALIDRLVDELERIDADASVRVCVLAGVGGTFCAGYDLNLLRSPGTESAGSERDHVERLCSRVVALRIPTIAAVAGVASGAGCDLAVSCDVRIATDEARFSMPPAKLGLLYSREGMERLRDLVGPALAKEMLFSGELVGAERALAIGLVNRVVPAAALDAEVDRLAEIVSANAPLSVTASKRIVAGAPPDVVGELQRSVWLSADAREGPQAFRERRTPRFHGR